MNVAPPHYPRKRLGQVAQFAVSLAHPWNWVSAQEAHAITGVEPRALAHWARAGVLSCIQQHPGGPQQYLQAELVQLTQMRTGSRPTLREVRAHLRWRYRHAPDIGPITPGATLLPAQCTWMISGLFKIELNEQGTPLPRCVLIRQRAESAAAPIITGLRPRRAATAMRAAFLPIREAYEQAMQDHGMFPATITHISQQTALQVTALIAELAGLPPAAWTLRTQPLPSPTSQGGVHGPP
ncbi:hypothetical protein [Actinomadura kijaniata]|uniref:hypothetical protein n=1 Tax=Actinomadura kijaniata TaxID=46161 RepID=UPI00083342DB|nr:hypothetical protein [Actinomadura kijaniata]